MASPSSPASQPGLDPEVVLRQMIETTRVAANAAQAAAEAANAAMAASTASAASATASASTPSLSGKEFIKILPRPEVFRAASQEEEQGRWPGWYWSLKQYLSAVDIGFKADLKALESDLSVVATSTVPETQARSAQLYSLLASLMKGRSLLLVQRIPEQGGYEALRQLLLLFQPPSKVRSLGMLGALVAVRAFSAKESLQSQILELERAFTEYETSTGASGLSEELKSALLLKCLPRRPSRCSAAPCQKMPVTLLSVKPLLSLNA